MDSGHTADRHHGRAKSRDLSASLREGSSGKWEDLRKTLKTNSVVPRWLNKFYNYEKEFNIVTSLIGFSGTFGFYLRLKLMFIINCMYDKQWGFY